MIVVGASRFERSDSRRDNYADQGLEANMAEEEEVQVPI